MSPCPHTITAAAAYLRSPIQGSWLCAASCLSVLAASPWAEVRRLATSLPRLSILNTSHLTITITTNRQCRGILFCTSGVTRKAGKRQLLFVQHLMARKCTVVQYAAITIINTQPCLLCVEITRCPLLCAGLGLCRILCLVSVEMSAESWCLCEVATGYWHRVSQNTSSSQGSGAREWNCLQWTLGSIFSLYPHTLDTKPQN